MKISPNPTNEFVTIEVMNHPNNILTIFDFTGRVLIKDIVYYKLQINISNWSKGLYFVQAISNDGSNQVEKLIVR